MACSLRKPKSRPRFALPRRVATAPVQPWKWPIWSQRWSPSRTTMMTTTTTTRKTILTTSKSRGAAAGGASRNNARSARRRAREFALQGVYAWLLRGGEGTQEAGEIDAHIRDSEDFSDADAQWYKTLLHGVMRDAPALRESFL